MRKEIFCAATVLLLLVISPAVLFGQSASNCSDCSGGELRSAEMQEIEKRVKDVIDSMIKQILPQLMKANGQANVSAECQEAILRVVFGLRQLKGWALKIVDASGKPPGGMIEGTLSAIGSYDECIGTTAFSDPEEKEELFRGKYCTILVRPPSFTTSGRFPRSYGQALRIMADAARKGEILGPSLQQYSFLAGNNAFRFGLCVPSKCRNADVEQMASFATNSIGFRAFVQRCDVQEEKNLDASQKLAIGIISLIVLFVLIGTASEAVYMWHSKFSETASKPNVKLRKWLTLFSVYSNTKKLVKTTSKNEQETLLFLNGIRFFSMAWIILGHTYFAGRNSQRFKSMLNGYDVLINNFFAIAIINMTLAVDTFFFISGLLLVMSHWPKLEKTGGKCKMLVTSILRRYWRLTPSLGIVMLLMMLLPLFGSGPFWHETLDPKYRNCKAFWWMEFLYVGNWLHVKDMCIPEMWYLSANMQLYVLCLFFLIPLYRYPMVGLFSISILGFLGICITGIVTWFYDLPPAVLFIPNYEVLDLILTKVYHKTFTHLGPFCVGMIFGYLLIKHKNVTIKPAYQLLGWVAAVVVNTSVLYGVFEWNRGKMPHVAVSSLYAATHRTAWCLGVGWMVFMCASQRGGIINSILSWKAFVPLGKINYMMYMVHPLVLTYYLGSIQEIMYYSHYQLVYLFLGHFVISLLLSTLCYLLVELPFANMEKLLFNKKPKEDCRQSNFVSKL